MKLILPLLRQLLKEKKVFQPLEIVLVRYFNIQVSHLLLISQHLKKIRKLPRLPSFCYVSPHIITKSEKSEKLEFFTTQFDACVLDSLWKH